MVSAKNIADLARVLRRDVLEMTTAAGSGHPSSCLSAADLTATLFFSEMRYDTRDAHNQDNDEFILSKGHAAPLLYAALYRAGCIRHNLLNLRALDSPLEGHPVPSKELPWIQVATGSLGQGLSVGVGMALAAHIQKRSYRTYVLLGDSECAEGSVWEAAALASHYKLSNLCAIIDVNRLGQRGETMLGSSLKSYAKRFEAFGWAAIQIDGHSIAEIVTAFKEARATGKPTVIIAKTVKGKGVSFLEDKNGWHGRALTKEELEFALTELPAVKIPAVFIEKPKHSSLTFIRAKEPALSVYKPHEQIATRQAYGIALKKLSLIDPSLLVLDAEVSNSTYAEEIKHTRPEQFIECFIAEQNMIGMALGLAAKGQNVYASTFAAFLARAYDQLRMASLSNARFTVCGSHAGVSIGEDGASQMGLEDIALFRTLPNSTIVCPSDAISAEKLVYGAHKEAGIKYIRTTRPKTPVLYGPKETFPIGKFKTLRESTKDSLVLIGAGITTHASLEAHDLLKKHNISAAVIDLYCIKPLDTEALVEFIKKHGNKAVIAEDHYREGGIGEMLASICSTKHIALKRLAVTKTPHSGTKDELLKRHGIDATAIAQAALTFSR